MSFTPPRPPARRGGRSLARLIGALIIAIGAFFFMQLLLAPTTPTAAQSPCYAPYPLLGSQSAVDGPVPGIAAAGQRSVAPSAYLKAFNVDIDDRFASSVAIDGDTLVVGATDEDSDGSGPNNNDLNGAGAVYVFGRTNGIWTQQAYLKASNIDAGDSFGRAVAINGDTIVVGAPGESSDGSGPADNSVQNAGAAYVFVRTNGTWTQQAYLKAANAGENDIFGVSVAIAGDTVVVGAFAESSNGSGPADNSAYATGAAYVFVGTNGIWTQQAYLKASNAEAQDYFGMRVATEGDTVVVAAAGEDSNGSSPADNSARNAGAAYVFGRANGIWTQQAYLKSANIQCDDSFGHSVAIAGDTVVVGAPGEDSDGTSPANNSVESAGAAYVFGRTNGIWTQQAYLKAANPGEDDSFGYAVAIADDTVVVGAWMEDGNGSSPGDNSAPDAGAAYAFGRTNGIWIQQGYLKANSADAQDIFGESVAIVGNTVVVSAPWEDGPGSGPVTNGRDSGAAYIFDLTSLTSIQQEKYPLFLPFLRR